MAEDFSDIRSRYTALQSAIDEIIATGKSYQLSGSHAVTRADLPELRSELKQLAIRAAIRSGKGAANVGRSTKGF